MSIAILVVYAADVSIWVLPTCSIEGYFLRTKVRHKSEKKVFTLQDTACQILRLLVFCIYMMRQQWTFIFNTTFWNTSILFSTT